MSTVGWCLLLSALGATTSAERRADPVATAVESAHNELWRRFVDAHGVLLDFTALDGSVEVPTPAECRAGQPNALGWWSPSENGPMFNGMYLDAAVNRWRATRSLADADRARRLVEGLLLLASVSDVPGFVARGVAADGRSHYPMSSNDQVLPWYYGLWRYWHDGPATDAERERIAAKLVEVTHALVRAGWHIPAEPPFGRRGSFAGFTPECAPRLLFVAKLLHQVTGEVKWDTLYQRASAERGPDGSNRLAICGRGMVFFYAKYHSWTCASDVLSLRGLWELETDPAVRAVYARGLQASAELALQSLPLAQRCDPADQRRFEPDWRRMNAQWHPQTTEQQAVDLAHAQLAAFSQLSPRRGYETEYVREPAFAAWIVTLAPDAALLRERAAAVRGVLGHYDYTRLYYSQFFPVEAAWWRLRQAEQETGA